MINKVFQVGMFTVVLVAVSCVPDQETTLSEACADAFAAAAAVDDLQATHADLFPAYSACRDAEEWRAADSAYPGAIDGVDPIRYARTVCAGNQETLRETPICRAVNAPSSEPSGEEADEPGGVELQSSAETGLLGAPLPEGAELVDETPADPDAGRDPSQRYSVSAEAADIARFFDGAMPGAGWAMDGTSTETALFFRRGELMLGILINRDGGSFTLMGS